MRLLPMGRRAVLVEDPPARPAEWADAVRALGIAGVVDVVPAARTVLVRCQTDEALVAVQDRIRDVVVDQGAGAEHDVVVIPVRYDGADLDEVARSVRATTDEVVALHSGAAYDVAFCGFAPGFGYLAGLPRRLHLPRRPTPRTRVPAGSVAIAAEYSAVYPRQAPGGWHLIGTTDLSMFDPDRDPPAVLQPGGTVRFEPV